MSAPGELADVGSIGSFMSSRAQVAAATMGFSVVVWYQNMSRVGESLEIVQDSDGLKFNLILDSRLTALAGARIRGADSFADLAAQLHTPRIVFLLPSLGPGSAVDYFISALAPALEPEDVIVYLANSHYPLESSGLLFVGCGLGGGPRFSLEILLLNDFFSQALENAQHAWRRTVSLALLCGVAPIPAFSAALAFFDGCCPVVRCSKAQRGILVLYFSKINMFSLR
ncbi:hypothetical protein FB451DRAFT_1403173 [Mycena latifolia]|nr:hypothetical protein FB451DRAFT_1403173 [Mycena latifolia]